MPARAVRVTITGKVQGVGYRAWVEDEAERLGLSGWVRNRRDGSVEAVFAGDGRAVDAMVTSCFDGPLSAVVTDVSAVEHSGPAPVRFKVMPTE